MAGEGAAKSPASAATHFRFGVSVLAAAAAALIVWSIAAPIDSAVIAVGQIVVEGNRKTVQHLEGGVVSDILVREGDLVKGGDVIVRLDDTVYRANLASVDSQLAELYARRARLEADRDGADAMPQAKGVADVLSSPVFQNTYAGQSQLFDASRTTHARQESLLEERITQQEQRKSGFTAQRTSTNAQLKLINDELNGVRKLYEQGYAPLTRLRALERESERLVGVRGALTASIAEAESIMSEAKLEIEKLRETKREDSITELRDVEVRIADLEERRIAAADALSRTVIRAPREGRVIALRVHTIGGVIASGEPLMEIVPDGDGLKVAARVSPRDIEKVHEGQEALIRFSSFSARRTPQTLGAVRTVSADSLNDQLTGAPYYLVFVDLPDSEDLNRALHGAALVPGMPVETFIRTGKQPVISYLLRPLTDALTRSMREE